MSEFVLKVNGVTHEGWESINVQRSIEAVSGIFQLTVSDKWAINEEPRLINTDDECELLCGDLTLIRGFVDEISISYDDESHSITVSGRDRTGDLVDCSAVYESGQIFNRNLIQVAELLTRRYNVGVSADVDVGPDFQEVTIDDGETVFEVIERLARHRGVLLLSENGELKITRPSTERIPVPLQFRHNIKSCDATISVRERFRTYLVKAQSAASDNWPGDLAAEPFATVTDAKIRGPRLQVVLAEESATSEDCQQRGEWHRNIKAARGTSITYTVQGVEYEPGKVWQENRMVRVIDPVIGIDSDLLIVSVNYTRDDSGTNTSITVAPREAYEQVAIPEERGPF